MPHIPNPFRFASSRSTVTTGRRSLVNRFIRRTTGKAGFSLVEVVLSMGVVAVAFVPMMGLIPMGMTASRQAIDTTIQAQILQKMTGQAQETAFSSLGKMCDATIAPLSFDANGSLTTSATPVYKAAFATPVNTVLPGGATTTTLNTITIYIVDSRTATGQAATTQSAVVASSAAKKYTVFVANTGL